MINCTHQKNPPSISLNRYVRYHTYEVQYYNGNQKDLIRKGSFNGSIFYDPYYTQNITYGDCVTFELSLPEKSSGIARFKNRNITFKADKYETYVTLSGFDLGKNTVTFTVYYNCESQTMDCEVFAKPKLTVPATMLAGENAGAVFSIMGEDTPDTTTIINTPFDKNSAARVGALYVYGNVNIDRAKFIENTATCIKKPLEASDYGYGAAMEGNFGKTVIKNREFIKNTVKYGAIRLVSAEVTMNGNTFKNNSEGTIYPGYCKSKYPSDCVLNDNLTPVKMFKLTATSKLTASYKSGKTIKIRVTDTKNNPVKKFSVYIEDGKFKKGYLYTTNSPQKVKSQ